MARTTDYLTVCCVLTALAAMKADVLGEAYSGVGADRDTVSVTYAMAANTGYALENLDGWLTPQMLADLDEAHNYPTPGPVEAADEIPTEKQYYDGSSSHVHCELFNSSSSCTEQAACTWCPPTESCLQDQTCTAVSFLEIN